MRLHIVCDNVKHLPEARVMCLRIVRDNLKHLPEAKVMCLNIQCVDTGLLPLEDAYDYHGQFIDSHDPCLWKMFQIITDNV
jgi:hypothetical protein